MTGAPAPHRYFDPDLSLVAPDTLERLKLPGLPADREEGLMERVSTGLQLLFGTPQPVLAFPASLPVLREALLRYAVVQRALVLVAGWEGESLARQAEACGKEVLRLCVPVGQVVEPDQLRRFLAQPAVDSVLLPHGESESGARFPLAELGPLVHAVPDRLLLVDAAETWAAEPLAADQWGIDLVLAPGERALGLPPGLAFAAASPAMLDRFRRTPALGRGAALDPVALFTAAGAREFPGAVAPGLQAALDWQLQRIGGETLAARFARHQEMRDLMDEWAGPVSGWNPLAPREKRTAGYSVLQAPPGASASALREKLAGAGWVVGAGLGRHAETTVRVAHVEPTTPEDLHQLLLALNRATGAG
jgi:aspartate aminotransferase-like enzyme